MGSRSILFAPTPLRLSVVHRQKIDPKEAYDILTLFTNQQSSESLGYEDASSLRVFNNGFTEEMEIQARFEEQPQKEQRKHNKKARKKSKRLKTG